MKVGKMIGRGRTADVFEWEEKKILKLFHKNYPIKFIKYEYEVSRYLQEKLSFVPKVFDLVEYQERQGIIFEKIQGITLLDYLANNPLRLFKKMKEFAKLHVTIHNCQFTGFDTQKKFLENDIKRTNEIDEITKKNILSVLNELPSTNTLCHRDFHPDNVYHTTKGLIVIDWLSATEGAPAGDVARTLYILKHAAPTETLSKWDKIKIKLFQVIASRQYLKNYLKFSKLSIKEIKKWELVTITGRLAENIPQEKTYILTRIKKLINTSA